VRTSAATTLTCTTRPCSFQFLPLRRGLRVVDIIKHPDPTRFGYDLASKFHLFGRQTRNVRCRLRLNPKQFAGHSLRAGFLTSAASRGASIFKMMDVSRHRSVDTLRGYVRDAELFKDHAGAGLL
jgi:hypothetical protein